MTALLLRSAKDALFGFPTTHFYYLFIYLNIPLSPGFIPVVAVVAVVPGGFFFFLV